MAYEYPTIDVDRLFNDLQIVETDLQKIAALGIPADIRVPSLSPIKTATVENMLHIVRPGEDFDVLGVKAPSGVAEQPLGQAAINSALNRLHNGMHIREEAVPDESGVAWFSIENGLFKVTQQDTSVAAESEVAQGIVLFTEGADVSTTFDPNAEYEDRAVAAVRIPGYPTVVHISPSSEAVRFPGDAVLAAYNADSGFDKHTAGSKLAEMGIVQDKQNPHMELTTNRPGGPLSRQDQMARVMIRVLVGLAWL